MKSRPFYKTCAGCEKEPVATFPGNPAPVYCDDDCHATHIERLDWMNGPERRAQVRREEMKLKKRDYRHGIRVRNESHERRRDVQMAFYRLQKALDNDIPLTRIQELFLMPKITHDEIERRYIPFTPEDKDGYPPADLVHIKMILQSGPPEMFGREPIWNVKISPDTPDNKLRIRCMRRLYLAVGAGQQWRVPAGCDTIRIPELERVMEYFSDGSLKPEEEPLPHGLR
jgi:hypothetical protein